jgi:LmbE family N-acetylglucosaminyl deacetylase
MNRWRRRLTRIVLVGTVVTLAATPLAGAVEVPNPVGSILVVAPHPDDDVIGSAGITYNRADVTIVFMTNGDNAGVAVGAIRQAEAVNAQVNHLGRVESDLIFFGYPDFYLSNVWDQTSGAFTSPSTGRSQTYAERGLGSTDWYDYRMGLGEQHADYNRWSMIDDMAALIDQRRPDHIFVTSEHDGTDDHTTTYQVVEQALIDVRASDPHYGALVHETIVWHPDPGLWNTWPQNRNASTDIIWDGTLTSNTIEVESGGELVWDEREQFIIPGAWQSDTEGNPKSLAVAEHDSQGGLEGFIGRYIHRDEIFWADPFNYPILSIDDSEVAEGGNAQFTISRTGGRNMPVSVTATTSNGTATAPGDYTYTSQVINLSAGSASATFVVSTDQDDLSEGTETFSVTLTSPTQYATLGDATATGTINDDDTAALVVDPLDGLFLDEAGGSDSYRLSLSTEPKATVTVTLSADGQISADKSYLTFDKTNWDTPQIVGLEAIDDFFVEPDPHFGTVTHTTISADAAYNSLPPVAADAAITENVTVNGPTTAATTPVTFSADSDATSYAWRVSQGGTLVASGAGPELTITPAAGGEYQVEVTVTTPDSNALVASQPLRVLGDIAGSIFLDSILWLATEGVTKGCNPSEGNTKFCPGDNVTRGQMAAFLVRFLGLTDDGGGNTFVDDDGSIFEADIAKLAAAGITRGCNPSEGNTKFCPDDFVTREQMAAFLVRALGLTDDGGGNTFVDDDGSIFEADIAKLAASGITRGCNPSEGNTKFCPDGFVTREQMAAFLHRAASVGD